MDETVITQVDLLQGHRIIVSLSDGTVFVVTLEQLLDISLLWVRDDTTN